ncbi:hypothetical protein OQA88_6080 [Cercophora sp. LCS_1]
MDPVLEQRDEATKGNHQTASRHIVTLPPKKVNQERIPGQWHHAAFTATYLYATKRFEILVTDNPPPDCDREGLETGWARTTEDVCFHNRDAHHPTARHEAFLNEIAGKIKAIATPAFIELVDKQPGFHDPTPTGDELPETVEGYLFPETVKLQLVTRNGVMQVVQGHYSGGPKPPRPVSWKKVEELALGGVEKVPVGQVRLVARTSPTKTEFDAMIAGPDKTVYFCEVIEDWDQNELVKRLEGLVNTRQNGDEKLRALITFGPECGVLGVVLRKDLKQT